MSIPNKCIVVECATKHYAKGMCRRHYTKNYRHGNPLLGEPALRHKSKTGRCSVQGCDSKHYSKSYCSVHYGYYRRHGSPIVPERVKKIPGVCSKDGCDRDGSVKGMCKNHYNIANWHSKKTRGCTKNSYKAMVGRCYTKGNSSFSEYSKYGVCERWLHGDGTLDGMGCFIQDMGERPSEKHTIDRKDNSKGYSPENCRWADRTIQVINRRRFKNNKTGTTGVTLRTQGGYTYFFANLKMRGELKLAKSFKNLDDAVAARKEAEIRYFKPIMDSYEA